jgi:signal peptidase I
MDQKKILKNYDNRIAVVMALSLPGMGQIYKGELLKGICFFVIFCVLGLIGFHGAVWFPDPYLIVGVFGLVGSVIAVFLFSFFDAFHNSKQDEIESPNPSYFRWYVYLSIWLLGFGIFMSVVYFYIKMDVLEAFQIVTASMEPTVLRGDRVFADKTAYRSIPPKKNDVIVFIYPNDHSKVFIKRIEGLPGDRIPMPDGKMETVPNGHIFVAGDNRDRSEDSRTFGFVPLRDVIGKVRQVYYSSGSEGVRWRRIGEVINH